MRIETGDVRRDGLRPCSTEFRVPNFGRMLGSSALVGVLTGVLAGLLSGLVPLNGLQAAATAVGGMGFDLAPREAVEARLRRVSKNNFQRETELKRMFEESGCRSPALTEQPVFGVAHGRAIGGSDLPPNLVCALPSTARSLIIVGAHFDHVKTGQGVVDNWSGASLLPTLYASIRAVPRKHGFLFIGFTDEEGGLVGSNFYTAHLTPEQRGAIRAMINLDSLGLGPTKVFLEHSDRKLFATFTQVAARLKLPVDVVNVPNADEDSEPFSKRKIPTLMVHSVTPRTWRVLHSAGDTLAAIDAGAYYDTYHLLAAYLADLDHRLD